jgi:hypothetical protein
MEVSSMKTLSMRLRYIFFFGVITAAYVAILLGALPE